MSEPRAWLLVAQNLLHLRDAKPGSTTWWCVPRLSTPGDKCVLYKPLVGILLQFEILPSKPVEQAFCNGFAMATANVKIHTIFEPPITAKQLKSFPAIRQQNFIRRNFQGKAFQIEGDGVMAILRLSNPAGKAS
jgi:hypothetical protein